MSGRSAGWRGSGNAGLGHSRKHAATGHCWARVSGRGGENAGRSGANLGPPPWGLPAMVPNVPGVALRSAQG
jgi:hypothetical protein